MKISDFSPSSASGDPYAAIRALSRPVSRRHPPMDRLARAAQFAPFSALSGYGDVIHEAGRLTDAAPDLGEEALSQLDAQLRCLMVQVSRHPPVRIRYFVPDGRKTGGAYAELRGHVKRIDAAARRLYLTGGDSVALDDIMALSSPLFAAPAASARESSESHRSDFLL